MTPLPVIDAHFAESLERHRLLDGARRILVACSGGLDSTALAVLFVEAGQRDGLGPSAPEILLGHVHHGLRGADADADRDRVRALARDLGVSCLVAHIELPTSGASRVSFERAAREARYEVFRSWVSEHAIDRVALAHHAADQEETVLLRIARGTGLAGLSAMGPSRPLEGTAADVVRPLLDLRPEALAEYLRARGRTWSEDASNADTRIPRNSLRLEVLPLLERSVHPGVRVSLRRLAEQARTWRSDLDALAERALGEACREVSEDAGHVELDLEQLAQWPPTVRARVLVLAVQRCRPEVPAIEARFVDAIEGLLSAACEPSTAAPDSPRALDLSGGLRCEIRYGSLLVSRVEDEAPALGVSELAIDGGETAWQGWLLSACRSRWPGRSDGSLAEWVAADAIDAPLEVRSRRDGDSFHPLGAPGRVPLKEFFRRQRVPPARRDSVPLVTCAGRIVWVVGHRLGEAFRIDDADAPALCLRARHSESESST